MNAIPQRTPVILVLDDDELIISTLRGLFTLETDYDVVTLTDPLQALEEVRRRPVDLIISDFLMPEMNGVEFLKQVKEVQPEATRILLTGFADKENAIRAINEVGLYQYIEKPWNNDDLLILIRNALEEKSLRQQLSEKISALDRLLREHAQLTDRHRSLERELDMAARVQRSLLPDDMPQLDGFRFGRYYEPCTALGGDYYDFVRTENATVILVSDVSGHGVQAALTSMLLKSIFQDSAVRAATPADLLVEMNERLHKYLPMGMFACASVAWVQPGSAKIQLSNAGMPYPFLLRPNNERVGEIPAAGLPLGLFDGQAPDSYDTHDLELCPGDVLLVTSDGLGDIRNHDNRFFQDGELCEALAALRGKDGQEVIDGTVQRAREFGGGNNPDDICMVAITKT